MKNILFQGDSITDFGRNYTDPNNLCWGWGYVLFVKAILDRKYPQQYTCYNRGCNGNRISDLYARERIDGICLKPAVASFLIGVNDVWHGLDSDNGTTQERFRDVYEMMLEDYLKELPDLKIIIMEPFIVPGENTSATPERFKRFKEDVCERARIARETAEKFGAKFVPLQERLNAEADKYGPEYVLNDGVHPTTFANTIIAEEWVKRFEQFQIK